MNFLSMLPASYSPFKNYPSSDRSALTFCCVRIRSFRSISSFNVVIFFLFVLGWALLPLANVWAWEVKTHEELTEEAINANEGDLNAYLINNLGLEGGLNESLPGGTPRELMKLGSKREDDPFRFFRHFHEPISNRGLLKGSFDSSINWSLKAVGVQDGEHSYSWNDAREYYFKALTSPTKTERDENWGKTFRALGHVMHLLQDSANPSHVRDDTHLLIDGLHDYMARHHVGSYLGGATFRPDSSMLEQAGPAGPNNEPFANLFDRNLLYQGSNPEATLGTNIGVTEFTNANFFSDDTIPGQDRTDLVYPRLAELVPASTIPFGPQYFTLPRLGAPSELKARVAKYTGNQSFSKFKLANIELDLLDQLQLDDLVYEAYSLNLIPRAVGYSAAVLTYFFRGSSPILPTDYCFQPGFQSTPPSTFFPIEVNISTPDQFQDGGEFYSYVDRPDGQRESMSGFVWESERLGIPFGMGAGFVGDDWGHPGPQRVTIVYQGKLGPDGASEPRGVVGTTHKITNFFEPCLQ